MNDVHPRRPAITFTDPIFETQRTLRRSKSPRKNEMTKANDVTPKSERRFGGGKTALKLTLTDVTLTLN